MYNLLKYLKHLLSASNQHGVHSPFVYDYITKCLYSTSNFNSSKNIKVLLKTIQYFSAEKVKIISKNPQIENRIQKEFGLKACEDDLFDLIYLSKPQADILSIYQNKIHNESIVLIENIHKTKDASNNWKTLKQNQMVTVSIDLFHCGILFFRKEQTKEHFKIRI